MKSDVAALEGILEFLLKTKTVKKKEETKKMTKKEEKEEDEEEVKEAKPIKLKGNTTIMSLTKLGAKKAPKGIEEKTEAFRFNKKKKKRNR